MMTQISLIRLSLKLALAVAGSIATSVSYYRFTSMKSLLPV